jgi:shikimate dehydrogenase
MSADPTTPTRSHHPRCAVLGSPIAHSLSPAIHRAAYAELGLDWRYDALEVVAEELTGFVAGLGDEWRGLSLTMPLKQPAVALCDSVEPLAGRLGAVNTMVRTALAWSGHNTDVGGSVDALRDAGVADVRTAVVVGSGATAGSVLAALAELGVARVTVLARSLDRAGWLVSLGRDLGPAVDLARLDVRPGGDVVRGDILASTVPIDAQAVYASQLTALVDRCEAVFDVVYEPRLTPVLAEAGRLGRVVVTGLDLLVHQAARQVVLMTGCDQAPVAAMRAAVGLPEAT